VSDAIYKRKFKFLTKLHQSENTICKLFEKYIIDELWILCTDICLVKSFMFFLVVFIFFLCTV